MTCIRVKRMVSRRNNWARWYKTFNKLDPIMSTHPLSVFLNRYKSEDKCDWTIVKQCVSRDLDHTYEVLSSHLYRSGRHLMHRHVSGDLSKVFFLILRLVFNVLWNLICVSCSQNMYLDTVTLFKQSLYSLQEEINCIRWKIQFFIDWVSSSDCMSSLKGHPITMYTVFKYGTLNRTRYTAVL